MEKFQLFKNAYTLCGKQPDKYISNNFKKFIDKSLPQKFLDNPIRKAMLTGYFLRCAENIVKQWSIKEPDQNIKNILNVNENDAEKIEKLANYLDNHDKIGLPEKISDYFLIPQEDIQQVFEEYAENFIMHTISKQKITKDKTEIFYEVAYRNIAFGYLYKLSEEFVRK
ncbi:MAG: hypothetical protein WC735_02225 [Candidatus Paceibacterota bacterium]|jgi:hypothetical protein